MPLVYASSKVLAPVIWILEKICSLTMWLVGEKESGHSVFLSQEELLKILEEQDEEIHTEGESEEINVIASNIFQLRGKTVQHVMTPLHAVAMLPSNSTINQMLDLLGRIKGEFIPIYHKQHNNIISIARPRDMLRASDTKRIRDFARPPWFITQNSTLFNILKQFRENKENCAVALDRQGNAVGLITLDSVLEEIFGKRIQGVVVSKESQAPVVLKNRIFPGDMLVSDFNKQFHVDLGCDPNITLSDAIIEIIGHPPETDDEVIMQNFNMKIVEKTLLGVKSVSITSLIR